MLGAHVSIGPVTRWRAVLLLWLLLTAWTSAIHLNATFRPPPGRVFVGAFHWIDDFYTYVSFAQQAEDGAVLFRDKLVDATRSRADIVNLEWWLVGRVSLALGRRPFLAYGLLGALATLALVAGTARFLAGAGVGESHLQAALVLVFLGGGLGGFLFELTDLPASRCLDLSTGAFPFLEVLANPHWVTATALLVWALWCFAAVPSPRGPLLGACLATALGLVRPYDAALVFGVEGLAVLLASPARQWPRRLLPLVPVGLVLGYNAWLLFSSADAQRHMESFGTVVPSAADLVPALGPAVLLALTARGLGGGEGASCRLRLALWAALALALVVLRPLAVSLQFVVGVGLPLLVLGAASLSRVRPRWTALAALCLSASACVATRIVLAGDPNWFVPRERLAAALALRGPCRPGDRVLAPPDIGLYVHGLTSCRAFVAHEAEPDYALHLAETRRFYSGVSPAARAEMADRQALTYVVLPGYAGPRPTVWMGEDTPFRAAAQVGQGPSLITIYARPRADAPAPARARDERLR
jgi:hypothetical protein